MQLVKEGLPNQAQDIPQLPESGERLLTEDQTNNSIEHLHRYAISLPFCADKDVLDIASGEGYGSRLLADVAKSVAGVDISEEAVVHAQAKYKKTDLRYIQGSAADIPLESNSVDVVISFETIEHHDQHTEMMVEIKRVLRPNGLLIISSPDKLNYTDLPKNDNPFHVKELYREEFRSLIKTYFNNVEMLLQKVLYGSLIALEADARGFVEHSGDFHQIHSANSLQRPEYNICFASDEILPVMPVSFFDGGQVLQALQESTQDRNERVLQSVLNSPTFRLGRALTWPLRKLFDR